MKKVSEYLKDAARRLGKRKHQEPPTIPADDANTAELDRERITICHEQYEILRRIQEQDFPRDEAQNWQRKRWNIDRANQLIYLLRDIERSRINRTDQRLLLPATTDESEQPAAEEQPAVAEQPAPAEQAASRQDLTNYHQSDEPVEGHVVFDNPFLKNKVEEEGPDAPRTENKRRKRRLSPKVRAYLDHPITEIGKRLGPG